MQLERFTVTLLTLRDAAQAATTELQNAHLAHLADLHDAGHLVAAGPLLDPHYRGLSILRADPQHALELKRADPAVRAGRFDVMAMQWLVPEGLVHFTPGRLPRTVDEVD